MGAHTQYLTIGQLSRRTGCKAETIRYYERIALLPEPPRTDGGHRLYGESHLRRLHFIRRSRRLGFTLDEIRSLLALADGEGQTCAEVRSLTAEHLNDVRRKIDDLKQMETALVAMIDECEQNRAPSCPVIDTLLQPGSGGGDHPLSPVP